MTKEQRLAQLRAKLAEEVKSIESLALEVVECHKGGFVDLHLRLKEMEFTTRTACRTADLIREWGYVRDEP